MLPTLDHPAAVGRFYDEHADAFKRVYGDVIQAFRTTDVTQLLEYEAKAMELAQGMRVLDAGCGVAAPAIFFAERYGVRVDGVTVSAVQVKVASEKVQAAGVGDRVTVRQADYHELDREFEPESYDVVCFLESFGHSRDKSRAIESAWTMLAPGGRLYIKDLFVREPLIPPDQEVIDSLIRRINDAYHYEVADLYDVLRIVRRRGFIVAAVKTVDIALEDFENLTISYDFQELTGINCVDVWNGYVFPVDFFELICIKPWYQTSLGNSRYFLQNLYQLRIKGLPPNP